MTDRPPRAASRDRAATRGERADETLPATLPNPTSTRPAVAAVIVAAGSGTRMGCDGNKVFLRLGDETVLQRSARVLAGCDGIAELVVVTREDEREVARAMLESVATRRRVRFVAGGQTRAESVENGVRATSPDCEVVLIHDGARPLVTPALVHDVIVAAARSGAAIPALPIADTLKRVTDGRVAETVDRDGLFGAQTPQGFRRAELLRALDARPADRPAPTDDAGWIEGTGEVAVVPGDPRNLKITRPADLALAAALIAADLVVAEPASSSLPPDPKSAEPEEEP